MRRYSLKLLIHRWIQMQTSITKIIMPVSVGAALGR